MESSRLDGPRLDVPGVQKSSATGDLSLASRIDDFLGNESSADSDRHDTMSRIL